MSCQVPHKQRSDHVKRLVLSVFRQMVAPATVVTLDTLLGKWGLGHTPVKRKMYYKPIKDGLAQDGFRMKSLRPNDFADVKKKTVGDIADMVEKDLA